MNAVHVHAHLRINKPNQGNELNTENFNMLKKEFEEDTRQCEDIPMLIEQKNESCKNKKGHHAKSNLQTQFNSYKDSRALLTDMTERIISKFIKNHKQKKPKKNNNPPTFY